MGDWSFEYDGVGNLKKKTDARGVITTQTFDQLDRILTINYPTNKDTTYTYDGNGKVGTLTSVSDGAGTVTYSYDNRLRKTQEQRAVEGITLTTQYTYDALDRITSKTNPDSTVVTYDFNNQGEIDEVNGVVDNIDYNALGKITKKDFANSLTTNYTYNTDDFRLNRIQTGSAFDSSYAYDAIGNITNIVDNLLSKTQYFGYDDLDRLTSASESAGFNYQYQYNPIGNLTQFNDGANTINYTYGQNAGVHALTSSTENGVATPSASTKRYAIYDDGLASDWVDWSWSSTNNLNDTSRPYIGTKNISWKINSAFAGLKLHKNTGIDTTGYSYLTVAIQASESGQLAPQVKLLDTSDQIITGSSVQLADYGGDPVASSYRVYSVPLSALNGSNRSIGGIIIQDITGSVQPAMYVDSIALTGVSADDAYTAEYFNNDNLSGAPELTRMDSTINFPWNNDGYNTGEQPVDHFSARWTKTQSFEAGDYKFSTTSDDGMRVYIDNELVLNNWNLQSPTTYTAEKAITGGLHDIRVEYFDHEGGAVAQFSYSRIGDADFVVSDEGLRPYWYNWSWGSTVNFVDTTSANTGAKHIRWQPTSQYAGLYLHTDNGFVTNNYTHLSFSIKATQSNQPIRVILFDTSNNEIGTGIQLSNYGGNPSASSYTTYLIPLADLNGTNRTIQGFNMKDISGNSTNDFYVDSIKFVNTGQ